MTPADGFRWTTEPWGTALRSAPLEAIAGHFFTTRQLWLRGDREAADWAAVAATIGVPADRLLRLRQVHGRDVVVVRRADGEQGTPGSLSPGDCASEEQSGTGPVGCAAAAGCADEGDWPEADVLATDDPSVALAIQVADCVPLLMADRRTGAVAGVHAGWRGTAAGAAGAAVDALARAFGTRPDDLVVAQGPCIGACCYEVGDELMAAFEAAGHPASALDRWFSRDAHGRLTLDLWTANVDQLVATGVKREDVHQCRLCTASHPEWFASYRRDGRGTGRIAAVIRAAR